MTSVSGPIRFYTGDEICVAGEWLYLPVVFREHAYAAQGRGQHVIAYASEGRVRRLLVQATLPGVA